jgi:hypothetical protein
MNRMTFAAVVLAVTVVEAQDQTRQIWDSGFRQKRPGPAADAKGPRKDEPFRYRADETPTVKPDPAAVPIGFTLWRLRPASSADQARLLVQVPDGRPTEYTQVRLRASEELAEGDRVRLGIEVPTRGHLYVVNRELLTDGTRGTPYLVFPSLNLRGGDNRVEPGRLIEIPAQTDRVPALVITRQHANYKGEELLVIVTPSPIAGLAIQERETALAPSLVAEWEERWGSPAQRLELAGAVASWTDEEKQAGLGTRLLTQADPMPQVLYHGVSKNGALLVRIPLVVR